MTETLISEFMNKVNQKEAVITLQVYLDLSEIKKYFDITYSFDATLNKFTIKAKKDKNGTPHLFIPITVNENLNFMKLQDIFKVTLQRTIFLVIVHADSTCVYYQITNGLLQPTDTTAKHLKEKKQEKLDVDLKKNRKLLEQGALFGLKVTIPTSTDKKNDEMKC